MFTYINKIVIVSNEKVPENAGLVKVSKADHVLHPLDGGGVHGLDPPLRGEPQLVPIIVDHLAEEERLTSDRPFLICFQLFLTIWLDIGQGRQN